MEWPNSAEKPPARTWNSWTASEGVAVIDPVNNQLGVLALLAGQANRGTQPGGRIRGGGQVHKVAEVASVDGQLFDVCAVDNGVFPGLALVDGTRLSNYFNCKTNSSQFQGDVLDQVLSYRQVDTLHDGRSKTLRGDFNAVPADRKQVRGKAPVCAGGKHALAASGHVYDLHAGVWYHGTGLVQDRPANLAFFDGLTCCGSGEQGQSQAKQQPTNSTEPLSHRIPLSKGMAQPLQSRMYPKR